MKNSASQLLGIPARLEGGLRLIRLLAVVLGACGFGVSVLAGCTGGSQSPDSTTAGGAAATVAGASDTAATVPSTESTTSSSTSSTSTTSTSTTSTSTTSTTTTSTIPPTTIVHGAGPALEVFDGGPVKAEVAATASSVYQAAITHDYSRLAEIIGDNRFRWGFVGDRKPAEAWKAQFDSGNGDELARIAALLDTKPGVDDRGNTVWPYVSLKDPATWDAADEAELARLGFNPENILDTRAKGRYVDYRLVIDQTGQWTAFGVGY